MNEIITIQRSRVSHKFFIVLEDSSTSSQYRFDLYSGSIQEKIGGCNRPPNLLMDAGTVARIEWRKRRSLKKEEVTPGIENINNEEAWMLLMEKYPDTFLPEGKEDWLSRNEGETFVKLIFHVDDDVREL